MRLNYGTEPEVASLYDGDQFVGHIGHGSAPSSGMIFRYTSDNQVWDALAYYDTYEEAVEATKEAFCV